MMAAQGLDALWSLQLISVIFLSFIVPGCSKSGTYLFGVLNGTNTSYYI